MVHGLSQLAISGNLCALGADPASLRPIVDALLRLLEGGIKS